MYLARGGLKLFFYFQRTKGRKTFPDVKRTLKKECLKYLYLVIYFETLKTLEIRLRCIGVLKRGLSRLLLTKFKDRVGTILDSLLQKKSKKNTICVPKWSLEEACYPFKLFCFSCLRWQLGGSIVEAENFLEC